MTQEFFFEGSYVKHFPAAACATAAAQKHVGAGAPREACVLFHGFPGRLSKNEDVGEALALSVGIDVFVVHYAGLGRGQGKFGFRRSIDSAVRLVRRVIHKEKGFEHVALFGHSWGGLVAINVAAALPRATSRLMLVSPYVGIPPDNETTWAMVNFIKANDSFLSGLVDVSEAVRDLELIRAYHNPLQLAHRIPLRTQECFILQAKGDTVTPEEQTRRFAAGLLHPPRYQEVHEAHTFPNRNALIAASQQWFQLVEREKPVMIQR